MMVTISWIWMNSFSGPQNRKQVRVKFSTDETDQLREKID